MTSEMPLEDYEVESPEDDADDDHESIVKFLEENPVESESDSSCCVRATELFYHLVALSCSLLADLFKTDSNYPVPIVQHPSVLRKYHQDLNTALEYVSRLVDGFVKSLEESRAAQSADAVSRVLVVGDVDRLRSLDHVADGLEVLNDDVSEEDSCVQTLFGALSVLDSLLLRAARSDICFQASVATMHHEQDTLEDLHATMMEDFEDLLNACRKTNEALENVRRFLNEQANS